MNQTQRRRTTALNLTILAVVLIAVGIYNTAFTPIATAIGFLFITWTCLAPKQNPENDDTTQDNRQ